MGHSVHFCFAVRRHSARYRFRVATHVRASEVPQGEQSREGEVEGRRLIASGRIPLRGSALLYSALSFLDQRALHLTRSSHLPATLV